MKCSVAKHEEFLAALMSEADFDDILEIDPFVPNVGNQRSQNDQSRVLIILDELTKKVGEA
jgi:hypothetical protein